MIVDNTPIEFKPEFNLWVKREDLSCPPPGPPFSKARGVYAHLMNRPEKVIGVLDTYHSQAGHAVARACSILGKYCVNYYPEFKHEPGPREPQRRAEELGAKLVGIKAGRSAVLYHQAKRLLASYSGGTGYTMPNALKLDESVRETAREAKAAALSRNWGAVVLPASSGTLAAGVIAGFLDAGAARKGLMKLPQFFVHMGYDRSPDAVRKYLREKVGCGYSDVGDDLVVVNEGYAYRDKARPGADPTWPCSVYYDLKAFRWLTNHRNGFPDPLLFWNIG